MSCNICCENFKGSRPKINCQYCEFEACRSCCEKYILSEEVPKCMDSKCGKEWSRKFLRESFTNTFLVGPYKEHVETILFDKEKALLPATQPIVQENARIKNVKKEIDNIDKLINDLYEQKRALKFNIDNPPNSIENVGNEHKFVRQCPANDCRGFLSTQWKCGLCEQWSCPDCHELKGYDNDCEHTCDPNSVATAKLLSADSKPCPKCQSLIFKIEGCDQMWCTQCKTAFSWKTGCLESKIHNPHYYEWLRQNNGGVAPRNHGDIECGRELNANVVTDIIHLVRRHSNLSKQTGRHDRVGRHIIDYDPRVDMISDIIRNMVHNVQIEFTAFRTDYFAENQDLRVRYLQGEINEQQFKILVQRNDKKNRKNTEMLQILQVCNTAVTDIIYRLRKYISDCKPNECDEFDKYLIELSEIQKYSNNILKEISVTYNSGLYEFSEIFKFKKIVKETKKQSKKEGIIAFMGEKMIDLTV